MYILSLVWQQPFLNDSVEGRMTVEIISWSISTKVWDWAGIELATPGSAVRLASVARHVTDCATRPGLQPATTNRNMSLTLQLFAPGILYAFLSCADFFFFKSTFFKKIFQEYHKSVKQFGSRSGTAFCPAWSGYKLFAKVISWRH